MSKRILAHTKLIDLTRIIEENPDDYYLVFEHIIGEDPVLWDIDTDHVLMLLNRNYGEWSYVNYVPDDYDEEQRNNYLLSKFISDWGLFKYQNDDNWKRMLSAYLADYNPIHNFDRYEKMRSDGNASVIDVTAPLSQNVSPSIIPVTDASGNVNFATSNVNITTGRSISSSTGISSNATETRNDWTDAQSVTAYDDVENYNNDRKNVGNGSRSNNVGSTQNNTQEAYGSANIRVGNPKAGLDAHIYGNIGVTTTQQMIQSELDLRQLEFTSYVVDSFVKKIAVLLPLEEDERYDHP